VTLAAGNASPDPLDPGMLPPQLDDSSLPAPTSTPAAVDTPGVHKPEHVGDQFLDDGRLNDDGAKFDPSSSVTVRPLARTATPVRGHPRYAELVEVISTPPSGGPCEESS